MEIKEKKRREVDENWEGNWDAIVFVCLVYRKLRRSVGRWTCFFFGEELGMKRWNCVVFSSSRARTRARAGAWIALESACALSCFVSFVMGRSLVGHGADCV
jgi:hypothetical protein